MQKHSNTLKGYVIKRRPGEAFYIVTPDGTRLTFLAVDNNKGPIEVLINAPKEYRIVREEQLSEEERDNKGNR